MGEKVSNVLIEDNYFTNNKWLIIGHYGSSYVQVRRNTFHNTTTWQKSLPNWQIGTAYTANQTAYNPGGAAVYTQTAASCTSMALGIGPTGTGTGIADGTCSWNFVKDAYVITNAFGVSTTSGTVTGSNNTFDDNLMDCCLGGDPFDADSQANFHAVNNRIVSDNNQYVYHTSGAGSGLYVYGSGPPGSVGVIIANNYIYGMTGNGIDVGCLTQATISNNVVVNSGGAGSALSASNGCPFSQVTYTGNVILNSFQAAAGRVLMPATNAATAAGNNVLHFADASTAVDGYFVFDFLNGAASTIPVGTKVVSHTGTTITMSANAINAGVVNGQTGIRLLPKYAREPRPAGGIWVGCVTGPCTGNTDLPFAGNVITDTQATKTQPYGINFDAVTVANVRISESNMLKGNGTAEIFGGVYVDGGTGSSSWSCGPGTGNTASGNFGSMACGFSATASGQSSRAMGLSVVAAGAYSDVAGSGAVDLSRIGWQGYASGQLAASGDAQAGHSVLRGTGNSTTPVRLTTNGLVAGTFNCASVGQNHAHAISIMISAIDHTAPANNISWHNWNGLLARGGTPTVALTMQATPTPISNGTVTGSAISVTGDNVNACLNISFTPPTGNTDTWNVVAEVRSTEVQ